MIIDFSNVVLNIIEDQYYNDVIEKYHNQNDFHLPSVEEAHYVANNFYQIFLGDDRDFMTSELVNDDNVVTINLFLGAITTAPRNKKLPVFLIKFKE